MIVSSAYSQAHRALAELGLSVPDDVSIIGYGDLPMLEYLPVPLTTVRVPKLEMGETAARLLIGLIESGASDVPERVNLETELVVRSSTRSLLEGADNDAEVLQWVELTDETASRKPGRKTP